MKRKVTEILEGWKSSERRNCLLIRGARQVGKTYSVEEFAESNYKHHLTVNLSLDERARSVFDGDLDVDRMILGLSALFPEKTLDPYDTLIFLDEIQDCPRARAALKAFSMDDRYDVIASGSLLGLRKNDVPSYPVGYEDEIRMDPMDFEEFLWAMGVRQDVIDHVKGHVARAEPLGEPFLSAFSEYFRWYTVVGGMPAAVQSFANGKRFDSVRRIQGDIIRNYKDDVAKHAEPSERMIVGRCFDSISVQLARDNKRFVLSQVQPDSGSNLGIDRYRYPLDWLENAGITLPCHNVTEPALPLEERRLGDRFKLYMFDTGLLLSMYDPNLVFDVYSGDMGVNKGAIIENLIATMLYRQGRQLLYYRRDRDVDGRTDRMELDFLITTVDGLVAVEVKSGSNRNCRSLNKVMDRYGLDGIMFETRDIHIDDKGVRHYPLFAAAFMDCIDPPRVVEPDMRNVDVLNAMFD